MHEYCYSLTVKFMPDPVKFVPLVCTAKAKSKFATITFTLIVLQCLLPTHSQPALVQKQQLAVSSLEAINVCDMASYPKDTIVVKQYNNDYSLYVV